jgi:rubrerythrin
MKEVIGELVLKQADRFHKILDQTGIDICTCGNCGHIIMVDTKEDDLENIQCPFCHITDDFCYFPDLYC